MTVLIKTVINVKTDIQNMGFKSSNYREGVSKWRLKFRLFFNTVLKHARLLLFNRMSPQKWTFEQA